MIRETSSRGLVGSIKYTVTELKMRLTKENLSCKDQRLFIYKHSDRNGR